MNPELLIYALCGAVVASLSYLWGYSNGRRQVRARYLVKHPWDQEDPRCLCCGVAMFLEEGGDWDTDASKLCHDCCVEIIDLHFQPQED